MGLGRVAWSPGRFVDTTVDGPADASVGIVLAPGAGAGRDHPFMAGLSRAMAAHGMLVTRFDYPYVAEGRRLPDGLDTLVAAHRAVVTAVAAKGRKLILAGKSMGGRVASHLRDVGADGFVFFGYPLVPIGKTAPRDTTHLDALTAPLLFIQGERDRLAPPGLLGPVVGRLPLASLVVIPEADHSFRVPKRVGVSEEEMVGRLAGLVAAWGPAWPAGGH